MLVNSGVSCLGVVLLFLLFLLNSRYETSVELALTHSPIKKKKETGANYFSQTSGTVTRDRKTN